MPNRNEHRAWVMAAVAAYEQRLVRFATRLARDEHAARDAVQHTFFKLCEQSSDRIGQALAQWLFTVCRNRCVDGLRQRRGEVSFGELDQQAMDGAGGTLTLRESDPAVICAERELGEVLLSLVDTLADGQREALLLWLEGWTSPQIAEITGRRPATIRVQLHQSLKALREHPRVRKLLADEHCHSHVQ